MTAPSKSVLIRFREALTDVYGSRLHRVVLFGSRARGEARRDSDYDVAVFLDGMSDFGVEARRIAEIEVDLLNDTGEVINAIPLDATSYEEPTGFMNEVRRDGVDLEAGDGRLPR